MLNKIIRIVSIHDSITRDGSTIEHYLPDPNIPSKKAIEIKIDMYEIIKILDERQRYVITKRFGLNGERAYRLREIGANLHVSREAIRQIEKKALSKLRWFYKKKLA